MKKLMMVLVVLSSIVAAAWYTGFLLRGYHALILCIAFLADYLTPRMYTAYSLDQAWAHWWKIGDAARYSAYQHDPSLQRATGAYATLFGIGLVVLLYLVVPWKTMRLKPSKVHGSAHFASLREARP